MTDNEIIIERSTQPNVRDGTTLIHGKMSGGNSNWSAKLMEWGNKNTSADFSRLEYWEGLLSCGHQRHIDLTAKLLKNELSQWTYVGYQHVVAHSNGCDLIIQCLLQNPWLVVDDLHLIAAWVTRDCRKHINVLLERGQVRRVFLYVSRSDDVLGWNILWPPYWGRTLGKNGPTNLSFEGMRDSVVREMQYLFHDLQPTNEYPVQVGVDNTMKHGTWVNPRNANDPGFNLAVMSKILSLSINLGV